MCKHKKYNLHTAGTVQIPKFLPVKGEEWKKGGKNDKFRWFSQPETWGKQENRWDHGLMEKRSAGSGFKGPVKPMEKILQIPVKPPRSNKPGMGKDQSVSCSRAWLSSANPRATVWASSGLRPLRAAEKRSQAVSLNLAKWAWK